MKRQDKLAYQQYLKKLELARSSGQPDPFESVKQKKVRLERIKQDFSYMVQYYFPHYADAESPGFHIKFANKVKRKQDYTGFCQWGRGLAKSVVTDIFLPFWLWLNGEPVYLVIVGNNHDKAKQLLGDIMAEFEANPRIIADYGEQKNIGSWEDGFFVTRGGFIGQALGMGQSVRGLRVGSRRPTLIVMDDAETKDINKNPKRQKETVKWVEKSLLPTMDGFPQRFIQANNRFAPVMIQTMLQERHPDWDVDQVNAYDPVTYEPTWKSKYDKDYYRKVEEKIGTLAANAEYNNNPHIEGSIFKEEMIQWAPMPRLNQFTIIIGRWDVAYAGTSTSDYNAVRVWGLKDRDFWYIDSFVKQSKMKDAVKWMAEFQLSLPKTVIVHWGFEAQFWNDEVIRSIEEVENEYGISLNISKIDRPKVRKYDRILSLHPYYQNGRMYYNDKKKHHADTQVGLAQLYGIEPGYKTHDDAPDADEMCISELSKYIYGTGITGGQMKAGKYQRKKRF
jgi:phage terminase large subunit-like protein